ncbi:polyhydroxyalkanoate synthesis regulator [Deferribacter autotrophicus]|uniref:Polyhydroxyalkanoate synthesis regulator n=1 Tax=Deferribacter autotrophicus TaxID=500465 RepID=A0A5A8F5J4_9BACT|nr:polyhydroxyalkanoate synthesis regulator [Deferribacter autotrophicus]KAA0256899.1 polyhydroxyalkanoate synthesis regulator [Deferribacter autotrophicus]
MNELAKKLIFAGIGLASLTEEKAKEFYESLIKKGEDSAKDYKLVKDIIEGLESNTKELEDFMEKMIKTVLDKMNLVSKDDLKKLEAKLAELEAKIESL